MNSQGEPGRDLLPQEIIFSTQNIKGKEHIVDISDLNIKLPSQGVFIAVEFIAIIDKKTGEVFYETNAHDKLTKREGFHMPTALIFYGEKEPNYWTFCPNCIKKWINTGRGFNSYQIKPVFWIEL